MATALHHLTPEVLFSRRAHHRHMAQAAKAFSAISLGAAFAFTASEAAAQTARASTDNPFTAIDGTPMGFTEDGDLRVMLASGEEMIIPRGEYGLVGDQIMVSDLIEGVEVAQNGYIPPTSGAYPTYSSPGFFGGLGYGGILIPVGLVAAGIIAYIVITRSSNTAPELSETAYSTSFDEDDTGTVLTVSATDAEKDTITFTLSGDDAEFFSISTAGAITFKDEPNFDSPGDADRDNDYQLIVTATDDHGKASSSPITVTVDSEADADTTAGGDINSDLSANNDDIASSGAITASFDAAAGNDSITLGHSMTAGLTGDMGSGADLLNLTADMAGAVTFDLGTGNDEIVLGIDQSAVLTIDLGTGEDIVDFEVAQATSVHVVQAFSSDDTLDLTAFNLTNGLDTTLHADTAAAQAALATDSVAFYDTGTDIRVLVDVNKNGAWNAGTDMEFTIEDVQALASTQIDF